MLRRGGRGLISSTGFMHISFAVIFHGLNIFPKQDFKLGYLLYVKKKNEFGILHENRSDFPLLKKRVTLVGEGFSYPLAFFFSPGSKCRSSRYESW